MTAVAAPAGRGRTARNIAWNYASGVTSVVGLVLLFPVAVAAAGAEAYGLWVVCIGLVTLLTTADLGLGTGLVRAVASARAVEDHARVRRVVSLGLTLFALLGVGLGGLFAVGLQAYLQTVEVPAGTPDVRGELVALSALALALGLFGRGAMSVLWGDDRYDIERKWAIGALVLRGVGLAVCVATGSGLLWVAAVEAVTIVLPGAACCVIAWRWHRWSLVGPRALRAEAGDLLRFSLRVFAGAFSALLAAQAPLYLAAPGMTLLAVTAFGAWLRLYNGSRMLLSWLATPFLAVAARRSQTPGGDLSGLHRGLLALTLGTAAAVSVPVLLVPHELVLLWLGEELAVAAPAVRLVGVTVLALGVLLPASVLASAGGRPSPVASVNVVWAVLSLGAVLLLPDSPGPAAVAACVTVPLVLLAPVAHVAGARVTGLRAPVRRADLWWLVEAVAVLAAAGTALVVLTDLVGVVSGVVVYGAVLLGYVVLRHGRRTRAALAKEGGA